MTKPPPYAEQYYALLRAAMDQPATVNQRTGTRVRTLPGNSGFLKIDARGYLPLPGNRRVYPHLAAAETAWQLQGTRDASFVLERAPKLWSKFAQDGRVEAAYGYRMRRHFGRDQLCDAVNALRADPTDRRVYVSLWDPSSDGLGYPTPSSGLPCPVGLSFAFTQGNKLAVSVTLRSSDLFVGLPYDVMNFALLGDVVATSLETVLETLTVFVAHGHVYEPQWEAAEKSLSHKHVWQGYDSWPELPFWSLDEATRDPEGYVETVKENSRECERHPWKYSAEVVA